MWVEGIETDPSLLSAVWLRYFTPTDPRQGICRMLIWPSSSQAAKAPEPGSETTVGKAPLDERSIGSVSPGRIARTPDAVDQTTKIPLGLEAIAASVPSPRRVSVFPCR